MPKNWSRLKKVIAVFASAVSLSVACTSFVLRSSEQRAKAADSIDMTGVPLRFIYASTDSVTGLSNPNGRTNGDVVVYRNVGTSSGGVVIDAVVTTQISGATIGNYDNPGSASNSNPIPGTTASHNFQVDMTTSTNNGTTTFVFDFYESGTYTGIGTGTKVSLRNVKVTAIDIDGSGAGNQDFQYVDLTGFQKYTTTSSTSINVSSPSTGVVRFKATDDSNGSNRPADRVQVTYDTMGRFTAVFGNVLSGALGYFGLLFVLDPWNGCNCTTVESNNPYNSPPTSSNTSRYVASGAATQITIDDFGNYADVDNNPFQSVTITALPSTGSLEFFNGTAWVAVTLNQVVLVSDIEFGYLRFTGSSPDSIGFKVFDGLALSTSSYTVTLSMATNPQSITFTNPGTKTSGQTFASGATASSSLTVTLTSLTPGVCTVSGLNITTVSNGVCTIKSTQPGDSTWSAALPVTQSFTVSSLAPQTITFAAPSSQSWGGTNISIPSGASASSGLTVTLVSFTPSVCTISGLTIVVIGPGTCRVKATQPGDSQNSAASPVEQTFQITAGGGAQAPTATTQSATSVTDTTAVINGTVNANGTSTTVTFCWGINSALAGCSSVSATPSSATGSSNTQVAYSLSALSPSTTYYFRVIGTSGGGTTSGSILSFTTNAASSPPSSTPSTTVPVNPGSVTTAKITGIVWFDFNKNNVRDTSEVLFAGVTVSAKLNGVVVASVVTDKDGVYVITTSSAGSYEIVATVPSGKGVNSLWDTSGNSDWIVPVTAAIGSTSTADFSAIGTGGTSGQVVSSKSSIRPSNAKVVCVWFGIDDKYKTADDVSFTDATNSSGIFEFTQIPQGKYSCVAQDKQSGVKSMSVLVSVTATSSSTSSATTAKNVLPFSGSLPETGTNTHDQLILALVLAMLGGGLTVVSRRRNLLR